MIMEAVSNTRKNLWQLFVPIFFETLFLMLAGMVDTLMLSYVNDNAVGAIGTSNTYISLFIMMFGIISNGTMAVMTQNIGVKRPGVALQCRRIACVFNLALGIIVSIILGVFADPILSFMGISDALKGYAISYLRIVGSFVFFNALIPIYSSYLRAFGHAKLSLAATVIANLLNIVLNAIFLYALNWGVEGVAAATVASRFINLGAVMYFSHFLINKKELVEREDRKKLIKQIFYVGLPAALETAIYNLVMTLVVSMLNKMDTTGFNVTVRSYAIQIVNFAYCAGAALASANAIMTGWFIGSKEFDKCNKQTRKAAIIGVCIGVGVESIICAFSPLFMQLITKDQEMIKIVTYVLAIDIVLEIGRVTNLVYGQALKTSGDAIFPVIIALVFMFLCAAGGTYLFGNVLGLNVVGAFIGLALDEICRAVGMLIRWKQGKWKEKSLVKQVI